MGVEDMQENNSTRVTASHFARCDLDWFKKNMVERTEDTLMDCQSWAPVAYDKNGPTTLHVHRAIAKKIEIWYRVSYTKSDAVFEKRIEYPAGVHT